MKYNHSMPCQCLIPNVVTAAVLSRTNAKKDSLKKGGVPDHASTMKANSEEPILFRGEESQLEDGPTNTHGSHGVLVALNTRRNLNFPGQTYVAIQDNQSTVSISAEDPELRDRERSLSHPAEVCPAEARKARSQNQKSEEPMGGFSEESFPGDRKQDVGSTFFNYRFKLN